MRYEASVVVNRPIEEVWAFLTHPFNIPRFSRWTLGLRQHPPGPMGPGTTWEGRTVFLGSERRITGVVTEWDPPHAVSWSMMMPGIKSGSQRYSLEPTGEGARVVAVFEAEGKPLWKLLWPIVAPFVRRQADATLRDIKRLLESGEAIDVH